MGEILRALCNADLTRMHTRSRIRESEGMEKTWIYPRSTACCTCMLTPACAERRALFYNPAIVRTRGALHPRRFERYCRFFDWALCETVHRTLAMCVHAREFRMRAIRCSNSTCDFRWRRVKSQYRCIQFFIAHAENFVFTYARYCTLTERRSEFSSGSSSARQVDIC